MKISNYYTEDDKPRLELKIKELDNIVTAWAEKTPINLGDKGVDCCAMLTFFRSVNERKESEITNHCLADFWWS